MCLVCLMTAGCVCMQVESLREHTRWWRRLAEEGLKASRQGNGRAGGKNKHWEVANKPQHQTDLSPLSSLCILVCLGELPCWILHAPEIDFQRIGREVEMFPFLFSLHLCVFQSCCILQAGPLLPVR